MREIQHGESHMGTVDGNKDNSVHSFPETLNGRPPRGIG